MLGAAIHLTPLWTWLRVVTCGAFSELKAGAALRVNGVPSSQSSDSCATGSGGTDVGGGVDETPHKQDGATPSARAAGFTRAAALLALFVYGFTKTFHGQLGSLFDMFRTASVASAGATATTSASSTSFMSSLNVSKVLSVASTLLVVVVLLIARSVRAACIKLHHLEGDDRFINVGTGSADATQPVPTTAPSTSRSGSMSISTLFWLIGVSITGKVVDYATCPDGREAGLSYLGLRLLGGARKATLECPHCERKFKTPAGRQRHINEKHNKPQRPDPIPAPTHLGFEPTTYWCMICHCGAGLCRYWGGENKDGKGGHHGCDDVEQHRAARREKANAVRDEYRAQEKQQGILKGGWLGDRIDWESSSCHGDLFETLDAAVRRFIDATPDWRNDATFLQRLAAHLFDLAKLDDAKKERLAGPFGLVYTRCAQKDPYDADELPRKDGSSIHYHHLKEVVDTLLGARDAGYLALLYLLVASKLLATLEPFMSGEMRRIFANNRTNARGDSCSKKLASRMSTNCEGPFRLRKLVLELAGLRFESNNGDNKGFNRFWQCYGGFGLRTSRTDLIRHTERLAYVCQMLTPEQGSRPGCDFGTLYALTQIFQAFASKIGDEALVGNDWHRRLSRGQGLDVRDALDSVQPGDRVDLAVMLHLGLIILFRNIDTSNMAALFKFFTETYDATIAERKTDRAYELRAQDFGACWGALTALDGYDIAFKTKKHGVVGHDPFGNDPRDAEIIAALARNLERLCKNIPWNVSMISGRAWGGKPELREQLLKKLMPVADLAFKLYHTEFAWRIAAAGDDVDKLLRAVREGWRDMDAGMTRDRANYLQEVDVAFFKLAPGLLEPLKSPRVIKAVIHDFSNPNWHEGVERWFLRDRVGYEFGKVVPTPAPAPASRGALKPANSPQHKAKKRRT